jgi:SAM-dependent methyltransferase
MHPSRDDPLWNGEKGAGGISWIERSRMGPLRGVIDAADVVGRRNLYMHALHLRVLTHELDKAGPINNALDFGCGTGRFIKTLATKSLRVIATDKEAAMVQAARVYSSGSHAEIVRCDAANVPFENAQFDFVLCSSVLCVTMPHLLEDILKELARVTTAGGTVLLLEQVAEKRGLALSRYFGALQAAGLKPLRAYPIRSSNSRFTAIAARTARIPLPLFDRIAAIELFLTRRRLRRAEPEYMEHAIVARRLRDDSLPVSLPE